MSIEIKLEKRIASVEIIKQFENLLEIRVDGHQRNTKLSCGAPAINLIQEMTIVRNRLLKKG